jgi:hypothetical protein
MPVTPLPDFQRELQQAFDRLLVSLEQWLQQQ